jgi:hypothetical protein
MDGTQQASDWPALAPSSWENWKTPYSLKPACLTDGPEVMKATYIVAVDPVAVDPIAVDPAAG